MNELIKSCEIQLIGRWEVSTRGVIADVVTKRIEYLIENKLDEAARSDDGWSALYQDKMDGRYWELTYPQSDLHGGGAPSLMCLSVDEAKARYKIE